MAELPNNACNLKKFRVEVEVDDYPTGRVGPLTNGGKDDLGWRGRQYFRTRIRISGQGFPDKHFRTQNPVQVLPDKPAGSCTTHMEGIISNMTGHGRRASLRVWDHGIPAHGDTS